MFRKAVEKNPAFKDAYYNLLDSIDANDVHQKYRVLRKILENLPPDKKTLLSAVSIIENNKIYEQDLPLIIDILQDVDPNHSLVKKYNKLIFETIDMKLEKTRCPLNILFVQNSPCIRNYKYARALRFRGHKVSLAYTDKKLSEIYTGLSDDSYDDLIKIVNFRDLWDISKNFDLMHCHNEPDTLTAAALAGHCPVIHDTHDLISLRDIENPNIKYFEGIANRGADGLIYTTPYQQSEAKFLYGIESPSLVFYNYTSANDIPVKQLPKLSKLDGNTHFVYEGGLTLNKHRNFLDIFSSIAKDKIHIHIYPTKFDEQIELLFIKYPNIHYYHPISPRRIIYEMSQYDFGIIPWNLQAGQKRFLDSTIANKLFEYLAAGLPVFTSDVESYVHFFKENPVGMVFYSAEDLVGKIPKLRDQTRSLDLTKFVLSYESEIEKLEAFYLEVIAFYDKKAVQTKAKCAICKTSNIHTLQSYEGYSLCECTECNVRFIDPMPDMDFLTRWYSAEFKKQRWNNDLNAAIQANHEQNKNLYPKYLEMIGTEIDLSKGGTILEIGCYSGLFLTYFDSDLFERIGIDLNHGFVDYGKKEYQLDLRCGDVFSQKFPSEHFDIVIFNQVLEHINDPQNFINEIKRITKINGYICFSVPNTRSAKQRLTEQLLPENHHHDYLDYPNHLYYYDKQSVGCLFKNSGFYPTMLETYDNPDENDNKESKEPDYQTLMKVTDQSEFVTEFEKFQKIMISNLAESQSEKADEMSGVFGIFQKKDTNNSKARKDITSKLIHNPSLVHSRTKRQVLLNPLKTQWLETNGYHKPKICHIGGAHSIHVADLVTELDKMGYEQCVISYMPVEKSITPRNIPVYHFNYKIPNNKNALNNLQFELVKYLNFVYEKEKPDLIHGHSHTYSALALWLSQTKFNYKTVVSPWSTYSIKEKNELINDIEKKCLGNVEKILYGSKDSYQMFKDFYGNIDDDKLVFFRPLLPMKLYEKQRATFKNPKILSVRVMGEIYRQDLLIRALPTLLKFNRDIVVTFLVGQHAEQGMPYFQKMKALAENLGVLDHCRFIDRSLSKEEFADMVYDHNIIYAISSHDEGYSGSATLAMYSGAITLVQKTEENKHELIHDKHLLKVDLTEESIRSNLIYAIDNLVELQERFKKNNRFLNKFSKEKLLKNVTQTYSNLIKKDGSGG